MIRHETLSGDKRYRYLLERSVPEGSKRVTIIMNNPSIADGVRDDHTIRRLIGFGARWNWQHLTVVNVFAYITTDLKELCRVADPIGLLNDRYLKQAIISSDLVIAAWGATSKLPKAQREEWRTPVAIAKKHHVRLKVFQLTPAGEPAHPLYLPYDLTLQEWTP